jgi:hypothetical protein
MVREDTTPWLVSVAMVSDAMVRVATNHDKERQGLRDKIK